MTEQAKHTPGPWRFTGPQNNGAFLIRDSRVPPQLIAEVIHSDREYTAMANACLIAAAPKLLEVLRDLVWNVRPELIDAARAVIAKAEGRPVPNEPAAVRINAIEYQRLQEDNGKFPGNVAPSPYQSGQYLYEWAQYGWEAWLARADLERQINEYDGD